MVTKELLRDIRDQFLVDWDGIHGISHWSRVFGIGMELAEITGGNKAVVKLFSLFHDSGRRNEGADPEHGHRGAQLAQSFRDTHLSYLPRDDFDLLKIACRLHTSSLNHDNVTVQTCFDADRLDLGRVGIIPDPNYLCTDAARSEGLIHRSLENSRSGRVPDNEIWKLSIAIHTDRRRHD